MTSAQENRFIMLRGPSGSGKTTIAKRLFALARGRTVLIHQDYYRFIFKPAGGGGRTNSDVIHEMIEHNCRCALAAGYDVILEGILTVKAYSEVLDRIIAKHTGPSFIFYFDTSFEETARRHETRQATSDFTVDDMRPWYTASHRSNHHLERLIPEHYSESDTIAYICGETLLDQKQPEREGAIQQEA